MWPEGDPWLEMIDYGWYMQRHSWPPEVVDRLPAWFDARAQQYAQVYDRHEAKVMAARQR